MLKRLVFVERDGGLIDRPVVKDGSLLDRVRLKDNCIASLGRFREAGFGVVVLIDRAVSSGEFMNRGTVQDFVGELFASQGVEFSSVLRCPHDTDAGCDCALPGVGLVADFIADSSLDRSASIVVGDGEKTLALARAMGLIGFVIGDKVAWPDIAHAVLDQPRRATVERKTRETDIRVAVDLDRAGEPKISTGLGFFDHMLEQLGKHGGFELSVNCQGDLEVDEHHTIEDVALALGQALKEALGDKRGIGRYGFLLPMDEAEAKVAIDLSGRAFSVFEGDFPRESVGGLPTELVGHFFRSLADSMGAAIHVAVRGDNAHHMVEACFKGVARALRQALARSGSELPSTKGTL